MFWLTQNKYNLKPRTSNYISAGYSHTLLGFSLKHYSKSTEPESWINKTKLLNLKHR